jgi:hypothetical protein
MPTPRTATFFLLASLVAAAGGVVSTGGETPAMAQDSLEQIWAERETPGGLARAIDAYEKAAEATGAPPIVIERLVRARYFLASERLRNGSDEQERAYERTVADGLRGLSRALGKKIEDIDELEDDLSALRPEHVGILYWTAIAYGSSIDGMSVVNRWGAAKRFKKLMERCLALDDTFFHGGPHRVLAGFFAQAPGLIGGDKKRAREEIDRAIAIAPAFAENWSVRAENVWQPEGDRARFESDLAKALELGDSACPDSVPEQKAAKLHAAELKSKIAEKF